MRRLGFAGLFALTAAIGCAPRGASSPQNGGGRFGKVYTAALEAEQADSAATDKYLDAIDAALESPDDMGAVALASASLDALVTGVTPGLEGVGPTAIAYRSRDGMRNVVKRLGRSWEHSAPSGDAEPGLVFVRALIAASLHELALHGGDVRAAEAWQDRRGCANAATVVGPLDWTPLRAVDGPPAVPPNKAFPESLPGVAPFAARAQPVVVRADECLLDVNGPSIVQGLRSVFVDFDNPRPQTIHVSLTTASAATLYVGGVPALRRGYEAGGRSVMRLASVDVPAGRVRVEAKVAQRGEGSFVELDAFGGDGKPLAAHAPRKGDLATALGKRPRAFDIAPASQDADEVTLAAAGLIGMGDARAAEHLLEEHRARGPSQEPPSFALIYVRAVEEADDVPENKALERMRAANERVLSVWPGSWEARIQHARSTERRKGAGDGLAEALRELEQDEGPEGKPVTNSRASRSSGAPVTNSRASQSSGAPGASDRMVVAYAAIAAKRMQLFDVAEAHYAEAARVAAGSPLLAGLDWRVHVRTGADRVRAACGGGLRRADTDCFEARRDAGDRAGAQEELDRLRRLRGAPDALRDAEVSLLLSQGDVRGALAVYDTMRPGERKLYDALGLAAGHGDVEAVKRRLRRDLLSARDAPFAIPPIERALGVDPDPAPALEAEGRKLVLQDHKTPFAPGAATAVLRHIERYTIEPTGLLRYTSYDLRRMSGTTDVAAGSAFHAPQVEGRGGPRLLRRRIHKRDGRVLEPDAAANAQQQSDLSQLETGDHIEQILEGWILPGDTGQLVIDTPDLMPERTSVREATIELRRAAAVPFSVWSHPLLGKAEEKTDRGYIVQTWKLKDQAPRRIEDGVPRPERSVNVSLGTQTWANIARAMEDNVRSLEDKDPFVRRFAREAGGDARGRALLDRVVTAVGKAVKVATPGDLSDTAALFSSGPQRLTARSSIELGQGSRAWLVYRVLKELGVPADIAVAETEPFSSSPTYPAHGGRFRHPLVVAHLPAPDGDVWIDADVEGPPLPPGRISPELRGRNAMIAGSGKIVTVTGPSGELGDQVDVRLTLDDKGDARGTFVVVVHGRAAQAIAEAFETVVGTDRRELLRSVVLGWVPWADVDEVVVSSEAGSWEIVLRAEIAVHGYGRPEGKDGKAWTLAGLEPVHVVMPNRYVGTLANTYASRGARQNALSIDVPLQYQVHRRITLPPGASIARAPTSFDVTDAHITASRAVEVAGSTVDERFSLNLPTGTVSADRYQAFVQKVSAIDDAFMAGTRVKVKP